jgi:hypothetical protein
VQILAKIQAELLHKAALSQGLEFMASQALWGLHQIQAFRSHAALDSNTGKFIMDKRGS